MNNKGKLVAGLLVGTTTLVGALVEVEGEGRVVYADKLAGGIPTVCAGHTDWNLRVGTPYTKEACEKINTANAVKYGEAIIKCSGHTEENPVLNQNTLDAFTLFGINVGIAGACGSRAMRLTKQGKHAEGCEALAHGPDGRPVWSYVEGGTKFVRGLYNRRLFERDWCLRPVPALEPVKTKTPVWRLVIETVGALA